MTDETKEFKVGDIVRLKSGSPPLVVEGVNKSKDEKDTWIDLM